MTTAVGVVVVVVVVVIDDDVVVSVGGFRISIRVKSSRSRGTRFFLKCVRGIIVCGVSLAKAPLASRVGNTPKSQFFSQTFRFSQISSLFVVLLFFSRTR